MTSMNSFIAIPGLGIEDVAVVQSLLESAGFIFHVHEGFGESPAVILIRERDVPAIKKLLAHYRLRTPSDKKAPIPW